MYFALSIPPCISRRRLAFGAMDLSFLNFIRARNPSSARRDDRNGAQRGSSHLHRVFRREIHTFYKYPSPLYIPPFTLGIFAYRGGGNAFGWNLREIRTFSLARVIRFFSSNSLSTGFSGRFFR